MTLGNQLQHLEFASGEAGQTFEGVARDPSALLVTDVPGHSREPR